MQWVRDGSSTSVRLWAPIMGARGSLGERVGDRVSACGVGRRTDFSLAILEERKAES